MPVGLKFNRCHQHKKKGTFLSTHSQDANAPTSNIVRLQASVPDDALGQRLDAVVAALFPDYSRSQLQSWIKEGALTVNADVVTKPNTKVVGGEALRLEAVPEDRTEVMPQAIDLEVVYEDEALVVINKPPGLVVHPGAGNPDGTLMNALLYHYPALQQVPRAGIVHRLDKDTSGLMVVAKTLTAQAHLVDQLQRHEVERVYDAVLVGRMIAGGTVDKPIGRHPRDRKRMAVLAVGGKPAVSHYRVKERFRGHTYVRVSLETGRTHQIRVHMAHLGFPLVGDPVYGGRLKIPKKMLPEFVAFVRAFPRQALHAGVLSLVHPVTRKTMKWKAPVPDDMLALMDVLRDDMADYDAQMNQQWDGGYDEFDPDHGVEVEWVTDADIPEENQ
ncbi:MAG: 23S rRNA pseudouridine(1911/1915/1917) synthase RluD [Hydrogenovibrio sp.]|uniref:23S rRNA pseudouridine(1911/1915/1917) synthase RluD n=1 Tax=Hydrogenovibrio sp. TaxID=2065821 RepID=UPI00286FD7CA|nr:23S rRNA pseudouridine(1911/1915/1917) synthase RluD [Hydrogenovibrio sp.]MDR9497810.1 23S rRNA pseudouridine(1911/1915/1917) synthase RluD [Hydrogenovibrio sp.]